MKLSTKILEKVTEFRLATGLPIDPSTNTEHIHNALYTSEATELLTADTHADIADALADMAVVMAGYYLDGMPYFDFHKAIIGLEKQATLNKVSLSIAFDIVHVSNMSKVCTVDCMEATSGKYKAEGVILEWIERDNGLWACYSALDYPDKPAGKLLKPASYCEPDWSKNNWVLDDFIQWNNAIVLPPTNTRLSIKLTDSSIVRGIRISHIKNKKGCLGYYMDAFGHNELIPNDQIVGWTYGDVLGDGVGL